MKTWLKIENNFVVGKMINPTTPGENWIEGNVAKVFDRFGNPCFKIQNDIIVPVNANNYSTILWDDIRRKRNSLLGSCDWTQMSDSPLGTTKKNEWKTYRQALRDLPEDFDTPEEVEFPTQPS